MSKFYFYVNEFTPIKGEPHQNLLLKLEAEGKDIQEAYEKIYSQIPEGKKVWFCGEYPSKALSV